MTIENTGRRPVSIYQVDLSYKSTEREYYYSLNFLPRGASNPKPSITINPNTIAKASPRGPANHGRKDNYIPGPEQQVKVIFKLNNGKVVISTCQYSPRQG